MVSSKETTPAAYLASLEPERRSVVSTVRAIIREHLPTGFVETMNWGMICYEVPLTRYPETYNGQPLMYVGLAAQKNNYALYLTNLHDPEAAQAKLAAAYKAAGRKFDVGKSCLRFKALQELPMDVLGEVIASTTVEKLIRRYEGARAAQKAAGAKKSAVKKPAAKKAVPAKKTPAAKKVAGPAARRTAKSATKATKAR